MWESVGVIWPVSPEVGVKVLGGPKFNMRAQTGVGTVFSLQSLISS